MSRGRQGVTLITSLHLRLERMSPSSNGDDDAQVFPDRSCSFIGHGGSRRAGYNRGRRWWQGSRSEPAIVGAGPRCQRAGGKTPSHDAAENGHAKTNDDAQADGHAARNAAASDPHALPFRDAQFQTKDAQRVSLMPATLATLGTRLAREGRRKLKTPKKL